MTTHTDLSLEEFENAIENGQAQDLSNYLGIAPVDDLVRTICRLDTDLQMRLLSLLSPEEAADVLTEIPSAEITEIFEQLPAKQAATIINELPLDEQADLIGDLEENEAEAIYAEMIPEDADSLRELAKYEDDTAGGLMATEFLAFQASLTVGSLVEKLEMIREDYADYVVQYIYVVEEQGKLLGVLRLRDLLVSKKKSKLSEIMIPKPLSVNVQDSFEDLKQFFIEHDLLGVPVVNNEGKLAGIVLRRDFQEAVQEALQSDQLKIQGIMQGEEFRSMPLLSRSGRRLSWLSINIVLNLMAASVIAMFQETLEAAIALAVFLPIISDMSGCSGSQAMAVSMRELTLGLIRPGELVYVWIKELMVGLINGVILGVSVAVVAWLWKGNIALGVVVGSALAINTMVAVSIGGVVPLILKKLGLDPAISSGPILTTITDLVGFFLVLTFASWALPLISS